METTSSPKTTRDRLTVPRRFSGPPGSANGGYLAGRLAAHAGEGSIVVTLRTPPPLETAMRVVAHQPGVRLEEGGVLVAEAAPAPLEVEVVEPVTFAAATEAARGYRGYESHPFPGCFVCGVHREAPDGLGLRPGIVPGRPDTTACPWVPDASLADGADSVPAEIAWAALDCPGGWTADLPGRPMVLGRMTAQIDARPYVGDRCVVMGRLLGREGRKAFTATTLFDGDGRVLGRARAVWIAVDPASAGRR